MKQKLQRPDKIMRCYEESQSKTGYKSWGDGNFLSVSGRVILTTIIAAEKARPPAPSCNEIQTGKRPRFSQIGRGEEIDQTKANF